MEIVEELPGKWYKSNSSDSVYSFAYHYQKHGIKELVESGRPIVSQGEYLNDAIGFWNKNSQRAVMRLINQGREVGRKIIGNPGGMYTTDGRVVSFWYVGN